MKTYRLNIITNYPRLGWLSRLNLPRTVPKNTAQRLAQVTSIEAAQDFTKEAGLQIVEQTETKQETETVSGVSLVKPEGYSDYFSPQIAFPKFETPLIPFGTVLFNCLLPETRTAAEGQMLFRGMQFSLMKLSNKLGASPFACLTGYKTCEQRAHDLYMRGFRFFFSPKPGLLYGRIVHILDVFSKLSRMPEGAELAKEQTQVNEKLAVFTELEQLKSDITDDGAVGHTILNDIRPMAEATILIDLR